MEKTHLSLSGVLAQNLESIREIVSSNPAATQTEIAQKVCEALNLCGSRNRLPVRSCRRILRRICKKGADRAA